MTVYVDLLLCYNLLVHLCLLCSTAAVCGVKLRVWRVLCGCILGSIGSFAIFCSLSVWQLMVLKTMLAVLLTLLTFGFGGIRRFGRRLFAFLTVNLVYAGGMLAVTQTVRPKGIYYHNGVAYAAGETGGYLAGLLLCYLLLQLGVRMIRKCCGKTEYPVYLRVGDKTVICSGFCDNGNRICDLYTGKPVVILAPEIAEKILPASLQKANEKELLSEFGHQIRLVPFQTVSGHGLLPVFVPDELQIGGQPKDFMAAISKTKLADGMEALLPAAAEW